MKVSSWFANNICRNGPRVILYHILSSHVDWLKNMAIRVCCCLTLYGCRENFKNLLLWKYLAIFVGMVLGWSYITFLQAMLIGWKTLPWWFWAVLPFMDQVNILKFFSFENIWPFHQLFCRNGQIFLEEKFFKMHN